MTNTLLCIDLGTTNTRIWHTSLSGQILARRQAAVGVRDCARTRGNAILRDALRQLISEIISQPLDALSPVEVVAAGMITSALGLLEVPHVAAPVSLAELASQARRATFPELCNLPFLLVPGVRCGPALTDENADLADVDIMRGEETLCGGLHRLGLCHGGAIVLNLASHWKAIGINAAGEIVSSSTSLSGEMMHAIQERTVLHTALPDTPTEPLDAASLNAGMQESQKNGLARALFVVRLMELSNRSTAHQRRAFYTGAFIAADVDRVVKIVKRATFRQLLLTGNYVLATAWQTALAQQGIAAAPVPPEVVERAMLTGLCAVFEMANHPA